MARSRSARAGSCPLCEQSPASRALKKRRLHGAKMTRRKVGNKGERRRKKQRAKNPLIVQEGLSSYKDPRRLMAAAGESQRWPAGLEAPGLSSVLFSCASSLAQRFFCLSAAASCPRARTGGFTKPSRAGAAGTLCCLEASGLGVRRPVRPGASLNGGRKMA